MLTSDALAKVARKYIDRVAAKLAGRVSSVEKALSDERVKALDIDDDRRLMLELEGGRTVRSDKRIPVSSAKGGGAGPRGEQGPVGPVGPQGPEGPAGPQGEQGIQGEQGPAGAQGDQGPQGEVGPQGLQGLTGPKGDTGEQGLQGPAGPQGLPGDAGPAGPQGDAGPTGPQGIQGPKGDTGDTGPAGPQGLTGPTGPQGPKGDAGDAGPQGPQGIQGPQGAQGIPGIIPIYNSIGLVDSSLVKAWVGTAVSNGDGIFTIDWSSAGFSQVFHVECTAYSGSSDPQDHPIAAMGSFSATGGTGYTVRGRIIVAILVGGAATIRSAPNTTVTVFAWGI